MKVKGWNLFKYVASGMLACGILATFIYVCIKGDLKNNILSWSCVIACFVLSLVFVKFKSPSIFITLGLGANAVADYFLLYNIGKADRTQLLIGLGIFCGVQFFYFIYTLCLNKSIAAKVFNIALRVAACLILYFIMPRFYPTLGTLELISLMYFANLCITFLELLFNVKTNWLLALGMFMLLISNFWLGMAQEGALLFQLPLEFWEILLKYNVAFWLYVPSLVVIALGSIFNAVRKKEN